MGTTDAKMLAWFGCILLCIVNCLSSIASIAQSPAFCLVLHGLAVPLTKMLMLHMVHYETNQLDTGKQFRLALVQTGQHEN